MDDFERRLRAVDGHKLTPWVRTLVGDPAYVIDTVRVEPLTRGFAEETVGGHGAFRYSGNGRGPLGARKWSLVLKVLSDSGETGSRRPRAWDFGRREILAYRSGLLDDLPDKGIAAPHCFAVEAAAPGEIWLWLEEAPASGRWTMATYAKVAQHLGQFNGAYLAGKPIPERRWFTRGRVREWLDLSAPVLDDLPKFLATRRVPHWLTERQAERVGALWRGREALLKRLEALPRCLCHHDAFPRNLFPGAERTIAIDWQIMGTGAVGEELMPLACIGPQFLHVDPPQVRELEETVIAGYVAGLRDLGWRGDERLVRLGYGLSAGLFGAVATVGMWPSLSDPKQRDASADMLGATIGEVLATWRELQEHFLVVADKAMALMEGMP